MANRSASTTRSKWPVAALGVAIGLVLGASALVSTALALHDDPGTPFELDGNATNNGGNTLDDWQNVFEIAAPIGTPVQGSGEVFIKDFPGPERQYDAGKDSLDLSGWTTKSVSNVTPDKNNIMNAFAKQYMVDLDGGGPQGVHRVIYFGADRHANNGDAALGFWFFQQRVEVAGNAFTPNSHVARNDALGIRGDILVQVDFVSGGSSSEIQIFEWIGNNAPPVGTPSSKLFGGGTLLEIGKGTANGSTVCIPDDPTTPNLNEDDAACATTNNGQTPHYWAYSAKSPVKVGNVVQNIYPAESFFEGGIDITALVGDLCFNSFLANTRTSHSETADLKDLALGDFNTCGSVKATKTCYADTELDTPSYNDAKQEFTTTHRFVIENDGQGGAIFDLQMRDNSVTSESTCAIIAVNKGGVEQTVDNPIQLPVVTGDNGWVDIPGGDSLNQAVNNSPQLVVTLMCISPENPFENSASVRAAQNDGGPRTLQSTDGEDGENELDVCAKELNPAVKVEKSCPKEVVWEVVGGIYQPKVCVDITVTNQGDTSLDFTVFDDEPKNGTKVSLLDEIPGATHRLAPEAFVTAEHCYTPTAPDEGTGREDPDYSEYSDTAKVTAFAVTDPDKEEEITGSGTTKCPLCPGKDPPEE
jgi:hypothetical protein